MGRLTQFNHAAECIDRIAYAVSAVSGLMYGEFLIEDTLCAFQVVPVKVHTERNILRGILLASLGHSLRRAYVTRILNTAVLGHLYIVPVGRYVHLVNVTAVVGVDPCIKH